MAVVGLLLQYSSHVKFLQNEFFWVKLKNVSWKGSWESRRFFACKFSQHVWFILCFALGEPNKIFWRLTLRQLNRVVPNIWTDYCKLWLARLWIAEHHQHAAWLHTVSHIRKRHNSVSTWFVGLGKIVLVGLNWGATSVFACFFIVYLYELLVTANYDVLEHATTFIKFLDKIGVNQLEVPDPASGLQS